LSVLALLVVVAVASLSLVPQVQHLMAAKAVMASCSQSLAPSMRGVVGVVREVEVLQVVVVQVGQVMLPLAPPVHLEPPTSVVGVGAVGLLPQAGMEGLAL
jgi:hypothetical protein